MTFNSQCMLYSLHSYKALYICGALLLPIQPICYAIQPNSSGQHRAPFLQ